MRYKNTFRPLVKRGSVREFFAGDPNLKGCWSLDGHARDESGNGKHGTIVGGVVPYPAKFGTGYKTDGTSGYISQGTFPPASIFSILYWTIPMEVGAVNQSQIAKYCNLTDVSSDWIVCIGSTKKVRFLSWGTEVVYSDLSSNKAVKAGIPALIICTFDSTYTKRIFIDGQFDISETKTSTIDNYTQNITVGVRALAWIPTYTQGIHDDWAFFNRVLSPAEISQYYQWAISEPRRYWFYSPVAGGVIVPWHLFPQNTLGQGVA